MVGLRSASCKLVGSCRVSTRSEPLKVSGSLSRLWEELVVVVGPQGFGLSIVRLLRTDCLGLGICMGSENDESDYSLGHYH